MSKTQKIVSRYDSDVVLFECDLPDGLDSGLAMRHALEEATKARANLADAYLAGANLAGANLADAYLADAYLADANLARANLAGANLADAYLADAYLAGANLAGANLAGANLAGANLAGAKWAEGVTISKPPVQIYSLRWAVSILDTHMQIGCELHPLSDWATFDDARIAEMDGKDALRFWREHKKNLLSVARAAGRSFEPVEQVVAEEVTP